MALEVVELLTTLKADISAFSSGMDDAGKKSQGLVDTLKQHSLAIGAAMTGLGATLAHFADPIEQSKATLEAVLTNAGSSFDELKGQIDGTVSHMENFGHGASDTQAALATLTTKLGDPTKALNDMGLVAEVAADKHISLNAAAALVGKVTDGNSKVLKQFGITVSDTTKLSGDYDTAQKAVTSSAGTLASAQQKLADLKAIDATKTKLTLSDQFALRDAQQAVTDATSKHDDAVTKARDAQNAMNAATANAKDPLTQLGDKLKGVAEAQADTFGGKMDALKTKVEDFAGTIGAKVGPALETLGPAVGGLGQIMSGAGKVIEKFKGVEEAATGATDAMSVAEDGAAVSEGLALGPILLIIAAVALIGVAIYELVTHWKTVWTAVKDAVTDAKNWISDRIDDVIGFFTALPGRLATAAGDLFHFIWDKLVELGTWWANKVMDLVQFYIDLPGRLLGAFGDGFRWLWNKLLEMGGWVSGKVDDVVDFFVKLPGRMASAAGELFHFMWDEAGKIHQWIAGKLDDLVGLITGIPGRLANAGAHMFDFIMNAFKGAWDWIAGEWNKIGFTMPEIAIGPVHFGGYHIDLPNLPTFALGGTVPGAVGAPQLAMVHGGEEITPWRAGGSQGGSGGGTTVIQVVVDGQVITESVHNGLLSKQRRTGNLGFEAA